MKINEILNIQYLPVTWIVPNTGTFDLNATKFGIIFKRIVLTLPSRSLNCVNISFGVIIDPSKPITEDNIDTTLTKFGKPRTVMSTVGNACVKNPHINSFDMIVVAANDQVKEKRMGIYTLAMNEIMSQLPRPKGQGLFAPITNSKFT